MSIIKSLFKIAVLGSIIATPAMADETPLQQTTEPDAPHQALANLVCEQVQKNKYVLLGDTNHGSSEIRDVKYSDALLEAIRDCTDSQIYILEGPDSQENILRNNALYLIERFKTYASDKYTFTDAEMERIEEALGFMKTLTYDVDVRFYDEGYDILDNNPEYREVYNILTSTYGADRECRNIALLHAVKTNATNPQLFWDRLGSLVSLRENGDNRPLADAALQNHPDGAVFFYGNAHMAALSEMLGEEDTIWIRVVKELDPDSSIEFTNGSATMWKLFNHSTNYKGSPDYYYEIDQQRIIDRATREQANTGGSKMRELTEDEYYECRDALPDNFKSAFTESGRQNSNDIQGFTYEDWQILMDPAGQGLPPAIEHWAPE